MFSYKYLLTSEYKILFAALSSAIGAEKEAAHTHFSAASSIRSSRFVRGRFRLVNKFITSKAAAGRKTFTF
jgi:hypothetical protein